MKLQDALDTFVYVPDDEATRIVVEAARKYADPDIEAGVEVLSPHSREIYGSVDELVKEIVDAALGVTEAPDG